MPSRSQTQTHTHTNSLHLCTDATTHTFSCYTYIHDAYGYIMFYSRLGVIVKLFFACRVVDAPALCGTHPTPADILHPMSNIDSCGTWIACAGAFIALHALLLVVVVVVYVVCDLWRCCAALCSLPRLCRFRHDSTARLSFAKPRVRCACRKLCCLNTPAFHPATQTRRRTYI